MKTFFITALLASSAFVSAAQTGCNIKKAYAFYTVSVPGVQMADEEGNPVPPVPYINRYIFIEWSGAAKPEIEAVLYNNKPLLASVTSVDSSSVMPGENIADNADYKITAKKCNSLWRISLHPLENNSVPDQNCKNIIIKTKGSGSICEFKLVKETELTSLPRY